MDFKKIAPFHKIFFLLVNLTGIVLFIFLIRIRMSEDALCSLGRDEIARNEEVCRQDAADFIRRYCAREGCDHERTGYRVHYNSGQDKCFVLVTNGPRIYNRWVRIDELYDIPHGRKRAMFMKVLGNGRRYYDNPSISCEVEGNICRATIDYDNFVRAAMEE